jgi:hypothetical protein
MIVCRNLAYRTLFLLITVALVALLGGCGGSSPTTSTDGGAEHAGAAAEEPSRRFLSEHRGNTYVTFGDESSPAERRAASAVLEENLAARQAADFRRQCASLAKPVVTAIQAGGEAKSANCVSALTELARPLSGSRAIRRDRLDGSIAALRVKGNLAYALYEGDDGSDYAMPMEREDGRWKVADVTAQLIN